MPMRLHSLGTFHLPHLALPLLLAALPAACDRADVVDDGKEPPAGGTDGTSDGSGDTGTTGGSSGGDTGGQGFDECPDVGEPIDAFVVDLTDANALPWDPSTCTVDAYTFDPQLETSTLDLSCANDTESGSGTVVFGATGHQALPLAAGDTVAIEVAVGLFGDGEGIYQVYGIALYDPSESPKRLVAAAVQDPEWGGYSGSDPSEVFPGLTMGGGQTGVCAESIQDDTGVDGQPCSQTWERWVVEFGVDGQTAPLVPGRATTIGEHRVALESASTLAKSTCFGDTAVGWFSVVVVPAGP